MVVGGKSTHQRAASVDWCLFSLPEGNQRCSAAPWASPLCFSVPLEKTWECLFEPWRWGEGTAHTPARKGNPKQPLPLRRGWELVQSFIHGWLKLDSYIHIYILVLKTLTDLLRFSPAFYVIPSRVNAFPFPVALRVALVLTESTFIFPLCNHTWSQAQEHSFCLSFFTNIPLTSVFLKGKKKW